MLPRRNQSVFNLWIFLALLGGSLSVKITNLKVPNYFLIEDDSPEELVLDCEYELEKSEKISVVKWLKDETTIYQWIPGRKPQPFRDMRDQIDSTYEASKDEIQKYRAIFLKRPYWNNTGRYKCLVHTDQSSDFEDNHLQIIDISNFTMNISQREVGNETEVKCSVKNIYPLPRLSLWYNEDERIYIRSQDQVQNDSGFFDSTSVGVLGVSHSETGDTFKCSLHVPGTNYSISTTLDSGSTRLNSINPVFLILIFTFSIYKLFE